MVAGNSFFCSTIMAGGCYVCRSVGGALCRYI